MGTTIRAEVSTKNRYWIDRHRYYELKHFCLQYPDWKKSYNSLDGFRNTSSVGIECNNDSKTVSKPTEAYAEARLYYAERIGMIERAAKEACLELDGYRCLLKAVTEGVSYEHLRAQLHIPYGKDMFYAMYRRFFWLLDKIRK